METITTFLATTPMFIFLVPVILILIVLLVVLNKSHPAEVVAQVPVPPVTTTPAPSPAGDVVNQEIKPVSESVVESMPAPEVKVAQVEAQIVEPAVSTPEMVPSVSEVPAPAPAPMPPSVETAPPVASWHPQETAPIIEETPVVDTMEVSSPTEQEVSSVIEQAPVVSDTISPQTVATEVTDSAPMVQEGAPAITVAPQQPTI